MEIFHVEWTECTNSKTNISYRHVYYTNKIESFVKYSTNWYPLKVTKLIQQAKEKDNGCPIFTPDIDINKDKEALVLEIIYQHFNQGNLYKSKEWYDKFIPMYKQSRRYSLGQKRKVEIPIWDDDNFLGEKRHKFDDSVTLKESELHFDTSTTIIQTTPTKKKQKRQVNIHPTPSKQLAIDMDSILDVPNNKMILPSRRAEICLKCRLPVEPINHQMCLTKLFDITDIWMEAYYAE